MIKPKDVLIRLAAATVIGLVATTGEGRPNTAIAQAPISRVCETTPSRSRICQIVTDTSEAEIAAATEAQSATFIPETITKPVVLTNPVPLTLPSGTIITGYIIDDVLQLNGSLDGHSDVVVVVTPVNGQPSLPMVIGHTESFAEGPRLVGTTFTSTKANGETIEMFAFATISRLDDESLGHMSDARVMIGSLNPTDPLDVLASSLPLPSSRGAEDVHSISSEVDFYDPSLANSGKQFLTVKYRAEEPWGTTELLQQLGTSLRGPEIWDLPYITSYKTFAPKVGS